MQYMMNIEIFHILSGNHVDAAVPFLVKFLELTEFVDLVICQSRKIFEDLFHLHQDIIVCKNKVLGFIKKGFEGFRV
jgi:hypothetical protein